MRGPGLGPAPARHGRAEDGVSAVETVIVAPVLVLLLLLLIGGARIAQAGLQVKDAAASAARAASLQRNVDLAAADGQRAAARALNRDDVTCSPMDVDIDVSSYAPGGTVTATVSCRARLQDLTAAGFPGSKAYSATAVVPVAQYRSR